MIALKIEDLKHFTGRLFAGEAFDHWQVRDVSIVTFNTFTIDGRIRPAYYSEEERREQKIRSYSLWSSLRPFCYSLIRGKRLPESFRITLQLAPDQTEDFLKSSGIGFTADQIGSLCLNIRYENRELVCVTGLSMNIFTLDKQAEYAWDEAVRRYLKAKQIPFTEEN